MQCFYCSLGRTRTIGTHRELFEHHNNCHPSMPFGPVRQSDAKQCALCPYRGPNIVTHFHRRHRFRTKTQCERHLRTIRQPFRLCDDQLNAIFARQLHKKQRCEGCGAIFDSELEIRAHHARLHHTQNILVSEYYDNTSTHLICNCCKIQIDPNTYLTHVEIRSAAFSCHRCPYRVRDMCRLVQHERRAHGLQNTFAIRCLQFKNRLKTNYLKTLVIFGCGLVVTKENLLGTQCDDSRRFYAFVDNLVRIKRERFERRRR